MARVIEERTDITNAMTHPVLGSISFYWGQEGDPARQFRGGNGVAKIIAKRNSEGWDGEAIARLLPEVIELGELGPVYGPEEGERRNITRGNLTAVLSLKRFGAKETWLLTGWKRGHPR